MEQMLFAIYGNTQSV